MNFIHRGAALCELAASMLLTGLSSNSTMSEALDSNGAKEVAAPASASGTASAPINIGGDGSINGNIETTGVPDTAGDPHTGATVANGPVVVTLDKTCERNWSVPAGSKLSAEQIEACRAGGLVVNVHTESNQGGEIRTQVAR